MMQFMGVMIMTATGCAWSSLGAAGAHEERVEGSAELPEADTDLHQDALSTGSLFRVSTNLPIYIPITY